MYDISVSVPAICSPVLASVSRDRHFFSCHPRLWVPEEPWWYHQHLLEGNGLKSFRSPRICLNVSIVLVTLTSVADSIVPESVAWPWLSSFPCCCLHFLRVPSSPFSCFLSEARPFAQRVAHSSAFAPTEQCSLSVWERREGQSLLLSGEADEKAEESKDSVFISC